MDIPHADRALAVARTDVAEGDLLDAERRRIGRVGAGRGHRRHVVDFDELGGDRAEEIVGEGGDRGIASLIEPIVTDWLAFKSVVLIALATTESDTGKSFSASSVRVAANT